MLGRASAERRRDPACGPGLHRDREVRRGQLLDLPVEGEHQRPVRPGGARAEYCSLAGRRRPARPRKPDRRPLGTRMMSPRRSLASERSASARRAAHRSRARPVRVGSWRRSRAYSVKSPWSQVIAAASSSMACVTCAAWRARPTTPAVGLELRERRLEQRRGPCPARLAGQVDGHVVRRAEAGVQRVGPGPREAGDAPRVQARLPQHDRVALDVDAAPPGPPGELGVLPRRQVGVRLAVPLVEPLDHDGAGGHVDAQRERLGGEHGADQAGREQLLDDLLERRQQPGVVRRDAAAQPVEPVA